MIHKVHNMSQLKVDSQKVFLLNVLAYYLSMDLTLVIEHETSRTAAVTTQQW